MRTIKTDELPSIPDPKDPDSRELERIRSAAFRTIQFRAQKVNAAVKEISSQNGAEMETRKACEQAAIVVIDFLKALDRTPSYKNVETIPIYRKEFLLLLSLLKDGEIGTEGLFFQLNQKLQILKGMFAEFRTAGRIDDLEQSIKIFEESRNKLLKKLKG